MQKGKGKDRAGVGEQRKKGERMQRGNPGDKHPEAHLPKRPDDQALLQR